MTIVGPFLSKRLGNNRGMLYGLYQSAVGADLQALKMETISNNIANAGTSSFKRDLAIFSVQNQQAEMDGKLHEVPSHLHGHPGAAVLAETYTDFSQGPVAATGADFDIALMGPGFLQVTDGEQTFLSRRGSLALNADSELVQPDTGLAVLDENGLTISLTPGFDVQFGDDGSIYSIDPQTKEVIPVSKLGLVQPQDLRTLQKVGDSMYVTSEETTPAGGELRIRQGFLEESGVQPVKEMLAMIETSRAFEANMNLIQHQDNSLAQLLQAVGGR